jgi:hypothetical protein
MSIVPHAEHDFKCGLPSHAITPVIWNYITRSFPFARHLFYCSDTRIVENFFVLAYFPLSSVPTHLLEIGPVIKLYCPLSEASQDTIYLPLPNCCPSVSPVCELASSLRSRCFQSGPQAILLLRTGPRNMERCCVAYLDLEDNPENLHHLILRMVSSAEDLQTVAFLVNHMHRLDSIQSDSPEAVESSSTSSRKIGDSIVEIMASLLPTESNASEHWLKGIFNSAAQTFSCLDSVARNEDIQHIVAFERSNRDAQNSDGFNFKY